MMFILKNILKSHFKELLYLVIGIIIYNNVKGLLNKSSKETLSNDETFNHSSATITDVQAKSYADQFDAALINEGFGDSMAMVIPIFEKLQNQDDFNKVHKAFGKRQYSKFWGNVGDPVTSDKLDLIEILNNEFSANERKELRDRFPRLQIF